LAVAGGLLILHSSQKVKIDSTIPVISSGEIRVDSAVIGPRGGAFTFDEGQVTILLPEGAVLSNINITCEAAPTSKLPEALKEMAVVGQLYRLGPESITFKKPVTIRVTLDNSLYNVAEDSTEVVPPILFTVNEKGEAEPLQDQKIVVGPGEAYIQGNITRFSWIVKEQGTSIFRMIPPEDSSFISGNWFSADFHIYNLREEELGDRTSTTIFNVLLWPVGSHTVEAEPIQMSKQERFDLFPGRTRKNSFWYFCGQKGIGEYGAGFHYYVSELEYQNATIEMSLLIKNQAKCGVPEESGKVIQIGETKVERKGTVELLMSPAKVSPQVGSRFIVTFNVRNLGKSEVGEELIEINRAILAPYYSDPVGIYAINGSVVGIAGVPLRSFSLSSGDHHQQTFTFYCKEKGIGEYGAELTYSGRGLDSQQIEEKLDIRGVAHCSIEENETVTMGKRIAIQPEGNMKCSYAGWEAKFTAVTLDSQGNIIGPVVVTWSSNEFGISQVGSSLIFTSEKSGAGYINATDIFGHSASIPFIVKKVPKGEVLLDNVNIKEKSNSIFNISKPVYGYNYLYVSESEPQAIVQFVKQLLPDPSPGEVFKLNEQHYLVIDSESYSMLIAPAIVKRILPDNHFNIDSALRISEGLKAQYVVSNGVPSLHFIVDGAYVGFIELKQTQLPQKVTKSVRELSPALNNMIFWVSNVSSNMVILVVAEEKNKRNINDGESLEGFPLSVNNPDFPLHGLSKLSTKYYISKGEEKRLLGTEYYLIFQYSMAGDLTMKRIPPPC
jgi:hypothetical protein